MIVRPGYGDEPLFYDRKGEPILDVNEWARLNEDPDYHFVRRDLIGDRWVITIWIGLDHLTGEAEKPHIFTSGVFVAQDRRDPGAIGQMLEEHSYATEEEAIAGHEKLVGELKAFMFGFT